jgi:hypothetical protein
LGITFDEWQCGAGRLVLARRADGKLAAMVGGVGMSLPRQVGKTYLLAGLLFALCVDNPGLLVIWSAHHSKTHNETFLAMQGFAKRLKVAPYIAQVFTGSGDEAVVFVNGSRILFGARERGFGRGIPGVDVLVMDEAQILSDKALENMLATLNTSQLGLALYIGTPPRPEDNSEAFTRIRSEALSGESDDLVWIECGADPDADLHDEKQWAKANPSFPHRTPRESILRLLRRLKADGFRHEGLGIWDNASTRVLIMPNWPNCATTAEPGKPAAIGVAMDLDRVWLSAGIASADKVPHLAPLSSATLNRTLRFRAADPEFGKAEFVAEVARISRENSLPVVLDRKGAASGLEEDLTAAGAIVVPVGLDDVVTADAELYDAVEAKEAEHGDYEELNAAVAAAGWRKVGPQRRAFAAASGEISMLNAVALAKWAVEHAPTREFWGGFG